MARRDLIAYLLTSEQLQRLTEALDAVRKELGTMRGSLRRPVVVAHLYELVATRVGGVEAAVAMEARDARLAAIKADILAHLSHRDLNLTTVAARHALSPRSLQRLFVREGMTFSQFVLAQRLARAYRLLTDPLHANRTVSTIAFASGFGDLSHFNRNFRRRYGVSPSQLRAGRGE